MARTAEGLSSAVVALHGWDGTAGTGRAAAEVARDVESNAYGPHSAIPCLRLDRHPGGRSLQVSLVALSRDTLHPEALREAVSVRVTADEASVVLTFLDGTTVEVEAAPSGTGLRTPSARRSDRSLP